MLSVEGVLQVRFILLALPEELLYSGPNFLVIDSLHVVNAC
jgi:hypothetical protein